MELCIEGLSKRYPNGTQALTDVSLAVPAGMFGLLGPNGAGKSTFMRTLATLQDADTGSARLGDLDVLNDKHGMRKILGYLPQEFGLYPKETANNLLTHFATLKGIVDRTERRAIVDALLEKTNLSAHRNKALGTFSGGMKQRFGIAQALLGNPKVVIVDEPTAGLDPEERVRFHNLLAGIGRDVIVILSTHIVGAVSDLCTNVAIIDRGRVQLTGSPSALIAALRGRVWTKVTDGADASTLRGVRPISERLSGGRTVVRVIADSEPGNGFERVEPDLEDLYFATVKNG